MKQILLFVSVGATFAAILILVFWGQTETAIFLQIFGIWAYLVAKLP